MAVCRKKRIYRIRWEYWKHEAQKSSRSAYLKQYVYRQGKSQKKCSPLWAH
jgi:hypothetical protein